MTTLLPNLPYYFFKLIQNKSLPLPTVYLKQFKEPEDIV